MVWGTVHPWAVVRKLSVPHNQPPPTSVGSRQLDRALDSVLTWPTVTLCGSTQGWGRGTMSSSGNKERLPDGTEKPTLGTKGT